VESVITARDVKSVYEVPLSFAEEGVDRIILRHLKLEDRPGDLTRWTAMIERMHNPIDQVTIALVGKYVEYEDSYKSLKEALLHGATAHQLKIDIRWIDSEKMENSAEWERQLEEVDGILVPGGFGKRGIEGMLNAIQFAREQKVPYFGICLGMQTMVIEYARNVCGLTEANSTEFDPATPHRVIYKLRELKGVDELGGTMRLGAWPCILREDSFAREAYGVPEISERHRHRYEFNREYEGTLTEAGLRITGETPDKTYVEICEIEDHPWYLGCQFHPEFKSKPLEPHPLFQSFVGAAYEYRRKRLMPLERVTDQAAVHV
jgi:CTP synthase